MEYNRFQHLPAAEIVAKFSPYLSPLDALQMTATEITDCLPMHEEAVNETEAESLRTAIRTLRNGYNDLQHYPDWVSALMGEAETAGTYTRGIVSDKRNRGTAVNVDVYGYDEAQGLAVVQVRQAQFHPSRYTRVRKDYYLLGHTEQGAVFAHPVDSPARSKRALETPESCVAYVLAQIWGCREADLADIVRQGDIALIPARLPKGTELLDDTEIVLRDTHRIRAERLYRDGDTLYAYRRVSIVHLRRQHATVQVYSGIYRVAEGNRAEVWGFSAPTAD